MRIAILLIPEALSSTITGPMDVLMTASFSSSKPWRMELVAEECGDVNTFGGIALTAKQSINNEQAYDLIIIPSLVLGPRGLHKDHAPICDWLVSQAGSGAVIASICTGAFLLSHSGLLDGHSATTHWLFAEQFKQLYPNVELQVDKTLVDNGATLCCSAGTAWQDLVIAIIKRHLSNKASLDVIQAFQLQAHNIGQHPFIGITGSVNQDAIIDAAKLVFENNFSEQNCIQIAIENSGLTPRTFQRRFKQSTGLNAGRFLQQLRVEAAKRHLCFSNQPIELISIEVGYEDASYLRRLFKKETGLSLSEYRKRFKVTS